MADKAGASHLLGRLKSSIRDLRRRHRDRHRPTGFGFVFADRVDYLDPVRWDLVTANGSIFLRRDVLRVIEEHGPENIQPRYAIIFRADKPVAVLAAQIVGVRGDHLRSGPPAPRGHAARGLLKRVLAPAMKATTANLRERMLVAGNLLSWGFHGVRFSPDEEPAPLWPAVAEALYRIRRAERLTGQTNFVMVKDLTPSQTGLEALHRFSYRPMATEPNMVLEIDPAWRNYEDYLAALDSKYRRNAKDQLKRLAAHGCTHRSGRGKSPIRPNGSAQCSIEPDANPDYPGLDEWAGYEGVSRCALSGAGVPVDASPSGSHPLDAGETSAATGVQHHQCAGGRYLIHESVDLLIWNPLLSVTNTTGTMLLSDPSATTNPWSFFQAQKAN